MLWLYILVFIVACVILLKSGTSAVKVLVRIARFLKWSEFITAFLLMAFTTSLPEFFVALTSAFNKKTEIAFGNVMGSNIINLTWAVALPVMLAGSLKARSLIARRSSLYAVIIAVLPLFLILDGNLSRLDGFLLLFVVLLYIKNLLEQKKRFAKPVNDAEKDWAATRGFLKDLLIFFLAAAFLLLSAQAIVWAASQIASLAGVSLVFISILFVALGTTLPEVIFGLKSVFLNHKDMVLGNLMGSVAANVGLVLGLAVLIHPLKVADFSPYLSGIAFTIAGVLFFSLFIRSERQITRGEGVFLILLYLAFVLSQVLLGS